VNVTTCPINPPGHDWQNGLTCRWCDATRTAAEAILSGLASRRGGDEDSARALLDTHRTENLTEGIDALSKWLPSVSTNLLPGLRWAIGVLTSVRDNLPVSNPTEADATAGGEGE
jgi:hypothetical protein